MNRIYDIYMPRATLTYTLSVLFTSVFCLLTGTEEADLSFFLQLFGFVVCTEVIDFAVSKCSFKTKAGYLAIEFLLIYVCFLLFSYFGVWFRFTVGHFILFTGLFILLFVFLHWYSYLTLRTEAFAINHKIKDRSSK